MSSIKTSICKCPTCGTMLDCRRYVLSHYVVRILLKVKELGYGPQNLINLLTKSEYCMVQVMCKFGMLHKLEKSVGYEITAYGKGFLEGKLPAPLEMYVDNKTDETIWETQQVYIDYFLDDINFGKRKCNRD